MNTRRSTLQSKLMLFFSIMALSLALSLGILLFKSTEKAVNLSKQKEIITLAEETSNKIDRFLFERYGDIQVMADSPLIKNNSINANIKLEYLDVVRKAYKTYDYIIITDSVGNIKILSGDLKGDDKYKLCLSEAAKGKIFVSDIMSSKVSGNYYIYFAAPIIDYNNVIQGAVIERMNFKSITDILSNVKSGRKGYVYMQSDNMESIAYPFKEGVSHIDFRSMTDKFLYSQHNGIKYLTAFFPISKYDTQDHSWNVVVEDELNEVYSVAYQLRNYTILVVLASALILLFLSLILSRRLAEPIKLLMTKAQQLTTNGVDGTIEIKTRDEVGQIAYSFNLLMDNLKEMINQLLEVSGKAASLEELGQYANRFFENLPAAIITTNISGRITSFNNAALDFFALPSEDQTGKIITSHPHEGIRQIGDYLIKGIEERHLYNKQIVNIRISNDQQKSVIINTSIQEDASGNILGATAVFRSLEEIKRMEDNLNRTKNLEALGAMSAGIAHEIRNPLTSIRGFAQYIKSSLNKDSELVDDIDIILSEVDRLNSLIDRFLTFANPRPVKRSLLNLNELILKVIKLLEKDFKNHDIKIIHDLHSLPITSVDEDQFSQVLINLLLNSMQAISENGKIIIETRFITASGVIKIIIRDNGKGIPEEILEKIFDPFFTTKDKGTGLGLAISARIIESHKGIIEVESEKDHGTVFTIQLPLDKNIQDGANK